MQQLDDQLRQHYENLLLKAQQLKLPEREMTIFDTALKSHHENPITELLAFFLDPNGKHHLGRSFYNGLVESLKKHAEYQAFEFGELISLATQQITENGKFIDLWLETDTSLMIIEVKVYHQQNNPFQDYQTWGENKLSQLSCGLGSDPSERKQLIKIVFCPQGECHIADWLGLSYQQFIHTVREQLGAQILQNPLNKWGIFARDFLLHLESFNTGVAINMDSLKFVVDNMQKIQALSELRENVYNEIIQHINQQLQIALGEAYEPYVRRHSWASGPALRFIGNNWKDWTDTVLHLHVDSQPMLCSITIYIQYPTDEMIDEVNTTINRSDYGLVESWYEQKQQYWCMRWENIRFDLDAVTKQIIFLHKILNRIELEIKPKLG